jgi:hypothetical protein
VTGLTFATSYRFRITPSFNTVLDINGQAITSAVTTGSPTVTNVVASKVTGNNTSMNLTWTAPAMTSGLTTYKVDVSTDGTTWNEFARANSTTASATVTGLTAGTSYRFRVTPVFNGVTPDTRFSATSAAITTNIYNIAYSQNILQDAPAYYFRMNGVLANSGSTSLTLNSNLWRGTYSTVLSSGGVTDGYLSANVPSDGGFRFIQTTDFYSDSVFTVSGWLALGGPLASSENIFHIANGYSFLRLYSTPEGRISADAGVGGNSVRGTVTGAPNANNLLDGRFHHFAWVSNGAIQSLYIDGALVGQAATYGIGFSNGSEVNIGRSLNYPDAKCSGSDIRCPSFYSGTRGALDEIALFNSALDATAISRHYAAGRELLP